jgi:hypothetical protein
VRLHWWWWASFFRVVRTAPLSSCGGTYVKIRGLTIDRMTSQTRSPFRHRTPFVAFRPVYALTKPRVVQLIVLCLDRHGAGDAGLPT